MNAEKQQGFPRAVKSRWITASAWAKRRQETDPTRAAETGRLSKAKATWFARYQEKNSRLARDRELSSH